MLDSQLRNVRSAIEVQDFSADGLEMQDTSADRLKFLFGVPFHQRNKKRSMPDDDDAISSHASRPEQQSPEKRPRLQTQSTSDASVQDVLYRLELLGEDPSPAPIEVRQDVFWIGRNSNVCHHILNDPYVSNRHCKLELVAQDGTLGLKFLRVCVVNESTTNLIFLTRADSQDGETVPVQNREKVHLKSGDEFRIVGRHRFRFVLPLYRLCIKAPNGTRRCEAVFAPDFDIEKSVGEFFECKLSLSCCRLHRGDGSFTLTMEPSTGSSVIDVNESGTWESREVQGAEPKLELRCGDKFRIRAVGGSGVYEFTILDGDEVLGEQEPTPAESARPMEIQSPLESQPRTGGIDVQSSAQEHEIFEPDADGMEAETSAQEHEIPQPATDGMEAETSAQEHQISRPDANVADTESESEGEEHEIVQDVLYRLELLGKDPSPAPIEVDHVNQDVFWIGRDKNKCDREVDDAGVSNHHCKLKTKLVADAQDDTLGLKSKLRVYVVDESLNGIRLTRANSQVGSLRETVPVQKRVEVRLKSDDELSILLRHRFRFVLPLYRLCIKAPNGTRRCEAVFAPDFDIEKSVGEFFECKLSLSCCRLHRGDGSFTLTMEPSTGSSVIDVNESGTWESREVQGAEPKLELRCGDKFRIRAVGGSGVYEFTILDGDEVLGKPKPAPPKSNDHKTLTDTQAESQPQLEGDSEEEDSEEDDAESIDSEDEAINLRHTYNPYSFRSESRL